MQVLCGQLRSQGAWCPPRTPDFSPGTFTSLSLSCFVCSRAAVRVPSGFRSTFGRS